MKSNREIYITITGMRNYHGMLPFKIGSTLRLRKDYGNAYDSEAIAVESSDFGVVGYVANSTNTVAMGTYSAGRLYDKIADSVSATVLFVTHSSVIAAVGVTAQVFPSVANMQGETLLPPIGKFGF